MIASESRACGEARNLKYICGPKRVRERESKGIHVIFGRHERIQSPFVPK